MNLTRATIFSIFLINGAIKAIACHEKPDSISQDLAIDEVVVTATRSPKTLKDVPVQTRLISAEEIRRSDATDLRDLLEVELPGAEFSLAMDQQVNLNLAGFAGQSVLILVDGERLAGETMDNVDFSRLLMTGLSRIEIVKGAASALYGSNAASGVINLITKEPRKPWTVTAGARYGSHNQWRTNAGLSFKRNCWSNQLDFTATSIDTYDVCDLTSDACDFRTVYGYKTLDFKNKFTFSPNERLTLNARAGYYFKERYYNTDMPDRYRDFTGGLRLRWRPNELSNFELSYAYDQYDKSDYLRGLSLDLRDYRNVVHTVRALYNNQLHPCLALTVGSDFGSDYLDTYQFAEGDARRQTLVDAFTQLDYMVNPHWELVGAVRYDYFSDNHNHRLTSKFNARYRYRHFTFRGGYAQGFRAPTLKEKYMDFDMSGIFDIHGCQTLRPETSHNFNISADYTHGRYSLTASCNYTLISDKISTSTIRYSSEGLPYIDYINLDNLRVIGFDATARARWRGGVDASIAYAFTHEQTTGNCQAQYCPARPHSLNLKANWRKVWREYLSSTFTLSGRWLSPVTYNSMYMYEPFDVKTVTNPGYTIWKVQLAQEIGQYVQLHVAVNNLFNYRPKVYSFNSPITSGTTFTVGLDINLN